MLGIFQTKKKEYNELILKSLVFGPKITNQIAEYICLNPKAAIKPKEANKNEIRKIVSIISRKGSRLNELEGKAYILRKNSSWALTFKGTCVALTLFNNVGEIFPYVKMSAVLDAFGTMFFENPIIKSVMTLYPNQRERFEEVFSFGKTERFYQFLKDFTNELISQGVDLDGMSEAQFSSLYISKGVGRFFAREMSALSNMYALKSLKEE